MNAQRLASLLLATLIGCGTSEPGADPVADAPPKTQSPAQPKSKSSPTEPKPTDDPQSATDADKVIAALSRAEQKVNATGVKQSVLLTIMNTNPLPEKRYHHKFEFWRRTEEVIVYKDAHSSLLLMIAGPPDDLTLIELMMPVNDFAGEQPDGQITGEGAAAFGRCVQRMTLAVDPNWVQELYDWMNKRIPIALLTKEGATVTRKGLMVKFDTTTISDDLMMVNFAIGVAENKDP